MKALQNLIPNSNKTDKASMLDEAIEYLKQLQLQVQMLSMRNGLNLHPLYMPGPLQPFQPSQFHMGFGADNGPPMNIGAAAMLSANLDSATRNSYDQPDQRAPPHQSIILPSAPNMASPRTAFTLDGSQSLNKSFQIAPGIFAEGIEPQRQLNSGRGIRNLQEIDRKPMNAGPLHFAGQVSSVEAADNVGRRALDAERPGNLLAKDPDSQIFQHLHG